MVYIAYMIPLVLCSWSLPSPARNVLLGILVLFVSFVILSRKTRDPYGSFHLALNTDETPNKPPATEWLNMGYWKETDSFPQACEALALKLIKHAGCKPGGHVLDVGHGSGDSLLLHLQHPSVPRPSSLTGITSLRAHHERSLERVRQLQRSSEETTTQVSLYCNDAVYHPPDPCHPLDPSFPTPPYTTILALDCAYHFRTRLDFLRQSYKRLAPGGTIALADICFSPAAASSWRLRFLVSLLGIMPKANVVSVEEYTQTMREMGYEDVYVEDITEDVFPGFRRFLLRRGAGWSMFARAIGWLATAGAKFVIVTGRKRV